MENIITSKENPVIRLYQKLSSSKKERLQYGLFVLEGLRIIKDAVSENAGITHLLVTEKACQKFRADFFQADLRNTKIIVISNELGNRISSTDKTQGIFAVCSVPTGTGIKFRENGRYIVLHGIQDPGNAGMIIRTADALGIDGIIMSGSCELYSPKVVRATMGSVFRVNIIIENDIDSVFRMLETNSVMTSAAVIDSDAENIMQCVFSGAQAVFIGNEGNGLPRDVAARCSRRVTIPMKGSVNSLNAAMAAGILMWEMERDNGR
ncbi:MAG: RNA methyltransferase [Ruminococcus sp.]|nr:RNA methyltransferase [Ruminococcus sp.]